MINLHQYLVESLKPLSADQLVKKLDFLKDTGYIKDMKITGRYKELVRIDLKPKKSDQEFLKNQQFSDILNVFRWYPRNIGWDLERDDDGRGDITTIYSYITLEPDSQKKCTDFVYNDCNGFIFHVTHGKYLSNILNSGLRIKGQDGIKNNLIYPPRLYFLCGRNADEIWFNVSTVIEQYGDGLEKPALLMIDLNKNNIKNVDFFEDTFWVNTVHNYSGNKINFIYSNVAFPKKCIEIIKNKTQLKKIFKERIK